MYMYNNNVVIIILPRYLFVRLSWFTQLVHQFHKFYLQFVPSIDVATYIDIVLLYSWKNITIAHNTYCGQYANQLLGEVEYT